MPLRRMCYWCIDPRFLHLGIVGSEWSVSCSCRFALRERIPGTHWIGGWVGHRDGVDDMEKLKFLTLLGLEDRPLGRSVRSQSLYRLCYRDSNTGAVIMIIPWTFWWYSSQCTYINLSIQIGQKLSYVFNNNIQNKIIKNSVSIMTYTNTATSRNVVYTKYTTDKAVASLIYLFVYHVWEYTSMVKKYPEILTDLEVLSLRIGRSGLWHAVCL
jgi:hypothetical protein